ncbi:MAG: MBL fold metallo-hydrolase [Syntrophotaleaceae bacterium]
MRKPDHLFRYLEPTFFAGLLDDPVLLIRIRPLGRNLLFDCGQIHHLAKRVLKQIDAIFISHAHMDHFMGIDTFIRHVLVSPRTFDLFGPPGLADKLQYKLGGYDWNLAEHFWCSLRVHEVWEDRIVLWVFSGPEGFARNLEGELERGDAVIYQNDYLRVEARLADHKIPVLMFRCRERPSFSIDESALEAAGLVCGPWLAELKRRFYRRFAEKSPLRVPCRDGDGKVEKLVDAAELYRRIRRVRPSASLGYITDVGFTGSNLARMESFLQKTSLLIAECAFLREDLDKARNSFHLCTEDFNLLLDRLRPSCFLPMHLSKTYNGRTDQLYRELSPPQGTTLLKLPEHLLSRPLFPSEVRCPEPYFRVDS